MGKKVSIKDIANQLNISITTVSFVINGKAKEKNISPGVTKQVLDLVAELNYHPSTSAQNLRSGKTKIIGFLVDDISEPFFSGLARFIDEKASEDGYKIIFSSTKNSTQKAIELLQIFEDRNVDGYIIALPDGLEDKIKTLIETKIPVVLFDRYVTSVETDYVIIDNKNSTFKATQHLIENGYTNIGFVTIDTEQQQMTDRLEGYQDAVSQYNLRSCVTKIVYTNSVASIKEITAFLAQHPDLDAVIFAANYICLDGLRAFRQMGLKIWDDLAVISFDDFELLEFCSTPVTAISQPIEAIAVNIMKILLEKLNADHTVVENKQIIVPASLIIRGSSLRKNK